MRELLAAEIRLEATPVGRGVSERQEKRGLEPTDRMGL
jgi:hypothetical protein